MSDDWGTKVNDSRNELSLRTFSVTNEIDGSGGEDGLILIFSELSFSSCSSPPGAYCDSVDQTSSSSSGEGMGAVVGELVLTGAGEEVGGFPNSSFFSSSYSLTISRLIDGSSCGGIDMVIKDLDLEPKIDAMMRDFLDPSRWRELSKETSSKILPM
ncbi:hypothetical protein Tco_1490814 [Tanacetum coccineum]